ncbi:hypothetical protein D0Z66_07995 [Cereibacter sphaeroides]|uniref:Chemotaxis protein n=2 Tax=Cereibacter TaxID=1653176 RepID=A4WTH7_CERS5|nr:hypothetical protein D0Z66_07995 [Cereibacter sphaeroides]
MTAQDEMALREVLMRLATRLDRLAAVSLAIEDAVGRNIARAGALGRDAETLQKLDDLVQSLAGLGAYAAALADRVDAHQVIDTRDAKKVVQQRSLLGTLTDIEHDDVDSGIADFF